MINLGLIFALITSSAFAAPGASRQIDAQTIRNGAATITIPTSTGTLSTLAGSEVLTNKTLTGNTAVNLVSGAATVTLPVATGTLSTLAGTEALTNKTLGDSTVTFIDNSDPTKILAFELSGISAGTTRTMTIPNASSTLAQTGGAQTFSSKSLTETNFLVDTSAPTKKAGWALSGATAGTTTTLTFAQTANRIITFPDAAGTLALNTDIAPTSTIDLSNVGISAAISSNTLVVSLKQGDGSTDCSSGSAACKVGFRHATATDGSYSTVSFTAAASVTLAAADSIGVIASVSYPLYVYLISDTASEVCLSLTLFNDHSVKSASALTGGADTTAGTLWCTGAHTSKPVRLIGTVTSTWSNPNWGSITNVDQHGGSNPNVYTFGRDIWRTESVNITATCSSSPCTVATKSDGVSSVTRAGTGSYSVNFLPAFAAAPSCTANAVYGTCGAVNICGPVNISTVTVSAAAVLMNSITGATDAAPDGAFTVICHGKM